MNSLRAQLVEALEKIDGIEDRPSPVAGGSALFFKDREFAHFHHDNELDIKLSKKVIKSEGLSHPRNSQFHPKRSAGSPWIELRFYSVGEVEGIVKLVQLALSKS